MTTSYAQKLLSFMVDFVVLVSIPRPGRRHGSKQFVCGWLNSGRVGLKKPKRRYVPRLANLAMESHDWVCKGCSNHMTCNTCVSFLDRTCPRGKKQQMVCFACVAYLKQYIIMQGVADFFNMTKLDPSHMEQVTITTCIDDDVEDNDSYTLVGYSANHNKPKKGVEYPPPTDKHNKPKALGITSNAYYVLDEELL